MRVVLKIAVLTALLGGLVPCFAAGPVPAAKPFPQVGLLPKTETGALRLLQKHPEYDGRGVRVAIFDTGVDPGAAGLQRTSDGRPKIVDLIDATGDGDVALSAPRRPQDGRLEGLTGRTLKLDPKWTNPRGTYRLGMKAGFDLFPGSLVGRLKRERRKQFLKTQRRIETKLRRRIAGWKAKHPRPNATQKRELAELEERLKQLRAAEKASDPGPVFDCVVFHDGKHWRAVVDTDEDGDLAEEQPLTNFRTERQFASFGHGTALNFSVNVYDGGKRLSIVTTSGAHGTHVAGIVAANYPDQPERNGIAPGAQIVSIKIGDNRLGGMETGMALVRGLRAVVEAKCDLINMSYGEPTNVPDRGRLTDLFNDIVRKHGVIFVASAGNEGPALSTVGSPGGTTSDVIGVGAYVSPQMMAVEYTLRKRLPGLPYTWTSRGPTFDGDAGVDIFAPGGAIAPVPTWTLQKSMRMNGTSMASPNACGSIALLLSALKATKTPYTPASLTRAIQNTARRIADADVFAQGPGLIQVDRACDYVLKHAADPGERLRYAVHVGSGRRGIYLRNGATSSHPHKFNVSVKPVFPEKTGPLRKVHFELRLALQSTAKWVEVGEHALLTHGGARFEVSVAPPETPGAAFAEVLGFDADNPSRGPLFRVPVTVVTPQRGKLVAKGKQTGQNAGGLKTSLSFEPGRVHREFRVVPEGATWADLSLTLHSRDGEGRLFVVHTVRAARGESIKQTAERDYVQLADAKPSVHSFPVTAGETVEICLAQYWSSLDPSDVDVRLAFRGLKPGCESLTLTAGEPYARVEVTSPRQKETLSPQAQLKTHRTFLRPAKSAIRMLDSRRDRLPDGRATFALTLTYEFQQKSAGSVTPRFPLLDGLLYDSPVAGQLWMLFDPAKRRIATDDMWPSAVKIGKGRHTLRLQVRCADASVLERLKSMPLTLDRPLKKPLKLAIYSSQVDAARRQSPLKSRSLGPGERAALVVAAPSAIPADAVDGDVLLGTISYGKSDSSRPGAGKRPGGYPLRYVVSATGRHRPSQTNSAAPPGSLAQQIRRAKLAELEKLAAKGTAKKRFETIAAEMLKQNPKDIDVLVARLKFLDQVDHRKQRLPEVVQAADAVLALIDTRAMAVHYGTNVNPDDAKAVALRKRMDRRKAILADVLYRKGRALGYMELPQVIAKHPIADPQAHDKAFEANFAELRKWVDTTAKKYVLLHVRRERRKERFGTALKLLNRHIPDSEPTYWYIKKRRDIYEKLGWTHLWAWESRRLMIAFPADFTPF